MVLISHGSYLPAQLRIRSCRGGDWVKFYLALAMFLVQGMNELIGESWSIILMFLSPDFSAVNVQ